MSVPNSRKTYLISYDLKSSEKDYKDLFKTIKNFGNWWHYLDSTWIIKTNLSSGEIWSQLKKYFEGNDYLFIVEITKNYAGFLPKDAWKWIKEQF